MILRWLFCKIFPASFIFFLWIISCQEPEKPSEIADILFYDRTKLNWYHDKVKNISQKKLNKPFVLHLPEGTIPPRQKLSFEMTMGRVELGRFLFYDPILSKGNRQSCAHCHIQKYSFGNNTKTSRGVTGQAGQRNTMTLVNLLWDTYFFWDGRSSTIEDAVLEPIQSPIEMNLSIEEALAKLNQDVIYVSLFQKLYQCKTIEKSHLANALAQFVGSLISFNSPLDYLHRYDEKLISQLPENLKEKSFGFMGLKNVFAAAQCGSCHAGPFLYGQTAFDDIGLDKHPEPGRGAISNRKEDYGKYKTTNLRNIAVSSPYMHDGRFTKLEDVIEHYNSQIKDSENLSPLLKDRESKKALRLKLTQEQKKFLVEFLKLMTDEDFLKNPYHANPFAPEAKYYLLP